MDAPVEEKEGEAEQEKDRSTNVWRGTPRIWERCMFCDLRKSCVVAGVMRGSSACVDARYSLRKR